MKEFNIFKRATLLIRRCSEKAFKIIRLSTSFYLVIFGISPVVLFAVCCTNVTLSGNNIHNNGTTDANWYYSIFLSEVSGEIVSVNNIHDNINAGEGIAIL
jgi:hypothetical protein